MPPYNTAAIPTTHSFALELVSHPKLAGASRCPHLCHNPTCCSSGLSILAAEPLPRPLSSQRCTKASPLPAGPSSWAYRCTSQTRGDCSTSTTHTPELYQVGGCCSFVSCADNLRRASLPLQNKFPGLRSRVSTTTPGASAMQRQRKFPFANGHL